LEEQADDQIVFF